jgi:hypothetical protein
MSPVFMFFQQIFIAYYLDATDFTGEVTVVAHARSSVPPLPFSAA